MIRIFELELLSVLQTEWKQMIANIGTPNDIIPDMFGDLPATDIFDMDQLSVIDIFKNMSSGSTKDDLRFVLQFPAGNAHVPCINIEVGPEQEDPMVGEFVGQETVNGKICRYKGAPYNKTYSIGAFSTNPITTLYLYYFVKYCVLLMRDSFRDVSIAVTSGRPIVMDYQRFAPLTVYYRYFDIRADGSIDYVTEKYNPVTSVVVNPIVD